MPRLPSLDGLRGVAILLVLMVHTATRPSPDVPSVLLNWLSTSGWVGVDLFFVLSGFLITGILVRTRGGPSYFRNFFVRRILRIWPLYYLTLAFALIVAPHTPPLQTGGMQDTILLWLTLTQNTSLATRDVPPNSFGILWSLAVEEQVYLVLPVLVLLFQGRKLGAVFGGMFLLALGSRVALFESGAIAVANYMLTVCRLDCFAVGGSLALLLQHEKPRRVVRRLALPTALVGIAIFVGAGVASYKFDWQDAGMRTWGFSVTAITCGAVLSMALLSPRMSWILSNRLLRAFGTYSYAIYLFHYPLWQILRPLMPAELPGGGVAVQLVAWLVMSGVSLVLAWIIWVLFESHVLALKRFFEAKRKFEHADSQTVRLDLAAPASRSS